MILWHLLHIHQIHRERVCERDHHHIYIYIYGIKYVLVYVHISFSTYFHAKAWWWHYKCFLRILCNSVKYFFRGSSRALANLNCQIGQLHINLKLKWQIFYNISQYISIQKLYLI